MSARGPRYAAKQAGQTRYWSDKPCPKGHIGEHFVNGACRECTRLYLEKRRRIRGIGPKAEPQSHDEFLAKRREIMRSWRERNRTKYRAIANKRYERHRERLLEATRKRNAINPEKNRERVRKWERDNPVAAKALHAAACVVRRTCKQAAQVTWADQSAIRDIYRRAQQLTPGDWREASR